MGQIDRRSPLVLQVIPRCLKISLKNNRINCSKIKHQKHQRPLNFPQSIIITGEENLRLKLLEEAKSEIQGHNKTIRIKMAKFQFRQEATRANPE